MKCPALIKRHNYIVNIDQKPAKADFEPANYKKPSAHKWHHKTFQKAARHLGLRKKPKASRGVFLLKVE